MSKSLNEAFIRAYSKDRSAASSREQDDALEDATDPFIVRIDTATVDIPPPHILNASTRPKVTAQVTARPESQAASQSVEPPAENRQRPQNDEAPIEKPLNLTKNVRASNASDLLRAGVGQQQFDAYGGLTINNPQSPTGGPGQPVDDRGHDQQRSSEDEAPLTGPHTSAIFRAAAQNLSEQLSRQADEDAQVMAESYAPVTPDVPDYTTPAPQPKAPEPTAAPSPPVKTEKPSPPSESNSQQPPEPTQAPSPSLSELRSLQPASEAADREPCSVSSEPAPGANAQMPGVADHDLPVATLVEDSEPAELKQVGSVRVKKESGQEEATGQNTGDANPSTVCEQTRRVEQSSSGQAKLEEIPEDTSAAGPRAEEASGSLPTEKPQARELESLAAPALSFGNVSQVVSEMAAEKREQGEIFRLDRPSYTSNASQESVETADDSIIEQSKSSESPPSEMHDVAEAEGSQTGHSIESRNEAARAAEEGLRQAKLRVFNPVWEVDGLQWPVVSSELLKQRSESLERVAQNLISACQEGLQVLAVTSPSGGEGRTTVACCLARLAGSHGLNVAILDGDIESPSLSMQTNIDVEQDWKTAIVNQMPLEEVAVHSIDDQVTLLPLLQPVDQDEIASDDNRIAFMLHELAESFDLVIVDMGHMDSTRSLVTSMGEQGMISAVVTVVDLRSSSPQRIEACIRRIRRSGISSIGLVENFAA